MHGKSGEDLWSTSTDLNQIYNLYTESTMLSNSMGSACKGKHKIDSDIHDGIVSLSKWSSGSFLSDNLDEIDIQITHICKWMDFVQKSNDNIEVCPNQMFFELPSIDFQNNINSSGDDHFVLLL
jgi:hypothetical protein